MLQYSVELMKSVFLVMATKNIDQYKQWSDRGNNFTDDTIRLWASAAVYNVCDPNEVVSKNHRSWNVLFYFRVFQLIVIIYHIHL